MSKPTKNRIFCPDCGRAKMLFETEKQANNFLKFNMDAVNPDGSRTMRVYYCPACCGYHISSHEYTGKNDKTDKLIEAYHRDVESRRMPTVEGGKLFDELVKNGFKTRSEVNKYLRSIKDVEDSSKNYARQKYYDEYHITKNSGYGESN